jgi:phosphoribosylformylglycinamidine (FGAM) synthase PurS component
MRTFKVYIENRAYALAPQQDTLEGYLRSLEGKTIKQILDNASYMRLYFGNKFGMSGPAEDTAEADLQNFASKLTNWVNRDISKKRPKDREYETDQFKAEHNYEEYRKARHGQSRARLGLMKARREENTDKMEELQIDIDKFGEVLDDHPYILGMRQIESEYDDAVTDYHNSPLTAEFLEDDGSRQYDELVIAFTKLGGDSETIVDV